MVNNVKIPCLVGSHATARPRRAHRVGQLCVASQNGLKTKQKETVSDEV